MLPAEPEFDLPASREDRADSGHDRFEGGPSFRELFEALTQGVLVHGPSDGRILDANPAAEAFLGLPREQLLGRIPCKTWQTVDEEGRPHTPKTHPVLIARRTGRSVPHRVVGVFDLREERVRWLQLGAVPVVRPGEEAPHRVYAFITDVTERRFRQLAELAPDGILVHREGRIVYANRAASRILDGDPDEIVGRSPFDFLLPEYHEVGADRVEQVLKRKAVTPVMKQEWRRLDGSVVCLDVHGGPCTWGGKPAVQAILRDVTEREEREEELRRAKEEAERANEAKSRFLSVMSHELRTPLNAIVGWADLLEAEVLGPLEEVQKNRLSRIRSSGLHLASIVDQILGYTSMEQGRNRLRGSTVEVDEIVRQVADMMEQEARVRGLDLRVHGTEETVRAFTDGEKLRQILLNLVGNAIKYTEEGTVEVVLQATEKHVEFFVRDSGPGIPANWLEDIFEPFVQVNPSTTRSMGGTGLGLAVCRKHARLLGGDVEVDSTPGEGSRFTVRLPRRLEEERGEGPP